MATDAIEEAIDEAIEAGQASRLPARVSLETPRLVHWESPRTAAASHHAEFFKGTLARLCSAPFPHPLHA